MSGVESDFDIAALRRVGADRMRIRPSSIARLGFLPLDADLGAQAHALERLYRAIAAVANAQVVIDSSKAVADLALALRGIRLEVDILHMVRDPRAVAYSRGRRIESLQPMAKWIHTEGPFMSSLRWTTRNALHELVGMRFGTRRLRMRYEDFVSDPLIELERLAEQVPVTAGATNLLDATGTFEIESRHAVDGNPRVLTQTRSLRLSADLEWQTAMSRRSRLAASVPATPLMEIYRYVGTGSALGGELRSYASRAFIGQVAFAAVAGVGSILAARLLGAHGKGVLTTWSLIAALGGLLASATIPVGLGRSLLAGIRSNFRNAVRLHAVLALMLALALGITAALLLGSGWLAVTCFVIIGVPCGVAMEDSLLLFQASRRPWAYQAVRMVNGGGLALGLAGVMVLAAGAPTDTVERVAWLSFALGSIGGAILAFRFIRRFSSTEDHISLWKAASLGKGSFVTSVTDWALLRLDQLLLVAIAGPTALGIYSVAVNWTEITQYAGHSIGQSAFKNMARTDAQQRRKILGRTVQIVALIAIPLSVVGLILIPTLFGTSLSSARWLVLLLAPGTVARSAAYTGCQMLLGSGRGRIAAKVQAVTLAVSIPLWVAAITFGGVPALAVTATLSYCLQFFLSRRALIGADIPHAIAGQPTLGGKLAVEAIDGT